MPTSSGSGTPILSIAFRALLSLLLVAATSPALWGQKSGGGSKTTNTPSPSTNVPAPIPQPLTTVTFDGQVIVQGGATIPERALIQAVCGNNVRASTFTDSSGWYTLSVSQNNMAQNSASLYDAAEPASSSATRSPLTTCEFKARLSGFVSSTVFLSTLDRFGMQKVDAIVLTPMGGTKDLGGMISVTSLQVPDKARKDFDKGMSDFHDKKFEKAEKHLVKALEAYPKYAAAWVTLGDVQQIQGRPDQAQTSYIQAITADSHFAPPYVRLAYLAARDKQWDKALKYSDSAITADPVHFPLAYFYRAVANFNLGQFDAAERAALKAVELDREMREPRVQLLLGEIYEAKGQNAAAVERLRAFIAAAPDAPQVAEARARLDNLEKSAAK